MSDYRQASHLLHTSIKWNCCGMPALPSDAASITTKQQGSQWKLWRLLLLGASVYLPVYPLMWIAKTSLQPPMSLLLATQGWITLSVSLLVWSCFDRHVLAKPNEKGNGTAP